MLTVQKNSEIEKMAAALKSQLKVAESQNKGRPNVINITTTITGSQLNNCKFEQQPKDYTKVEAKTKSMTLAVGNNQMTKKRKMDDDYLGSDLGSEFDLGSDLGSDLDLGSLGSDLGGDMDSDLDTDSD